MISSLRRVSVRRVLVLFALLMATESKAQDTPPDARVLPNLPLLDRDPVTWEHLAFSPNGKTLVADGERARNVRTVGASRMTEEFIQTWDLVTYRPDKMTRVTDLTARRMVPQFSQDGRTIYAHATENQMRDSNEGGGQGLHTRTGIMVWPIRSAEPEFHRLTPVDAGRLLALTVLDGGRAMMVAEPEGGLQRWRFEKVRRQRGFGPRTPQTRWTPMGEPIELPSPAAMPSQFSADGSLFFAMSKGKLSVWDVQQGSLRSQISLVPTQATRRPANASRQGQNRRRATGPASGTTGGARLAASQDGSTVAVASSGPRGNWAVMLVDIQAAKVSEWLVIGADPITGLALNGDGSRLVFVSAGKATLRNVVRDLNLEIPAPNAFLSACAISSDGRLAAAGAADGKVRLWKLSAPAKVASRDTPTPDTESVGEANVLLQSGPLPVYVQLQDGEIETRKLLRLTSKEAIFQGPGGRLERKSDVTYKRIASTDRSLQWAWNAEQAAYVGPTVPAPPEHQVLAAQPFTDEQEAVYLLASARRQLGIALERSERDGTSDLLDGLRQQATARAQHAASLSSHAASLTELYRELHTVIPVVATTSRQRREVIAEANRAMIEMAERKGSGDFQARAGMMTGLLGVFLGEAGLTKIRIPIRREQITDRLIHEHTLDFDLAPGISEWGMSQAMASLGASVELERQLRAAKEMSESETGKRLQEILERRQTALDRFESTWNRLAIDEMKLDLPDYSDPPSTKTSAALGKWLRQQSAAFIAASDRIDPLLEADLILLRGSPSQQPATLYLCAKQLIDLLPWIPAGEVYDPDRARLYGLAAGLVIRGVRFDARPRSTTDSYQRMAHRALSFLDRALELYPLDPDGAFRGKRAIALAQAGRQAEALQQARQLVAQEPESAEARYLLARLISAGGNVDGGLDELEKAIIEFEFPNLEEVRQSVDFPRQNRRFRDLVDVQIQVTGFSLSRRVQVRNRSRFALRDVSLRVECTSAFKSEPVVAELQLVSLGPGEVVSVYADSSVRVKSTDEDGKRVEYWDGELSVTAKGQGTLRLSIPNR